MVFFVRAGVIAALLLLSACGQLSLRSATPAPIDRAGPALADRPVSAPVQARAPAETGAIYTVRHGDTLYQIAGRHGYTYQQLAAWNNIPPPYTLYPGQVLRLAGSVPANSIPAAAAPAPTAPAAFYSRQAAASPVPNRIIPATVPATCRPGGIWRWPAQGRAQRGLSQTGTHSLQIYGQAGLPIYASAGGKVIYSGPEPGLNGHFGNLVIIEHNQAYRSVYAHNRSVRVREGESVNAGQQIADMGSDLLKRPVVRFEIRCQDKAVDPLQYLPRTL